MDISLCAIKGNKVSFSGANNPLWIIRKTESLTEVQKTTRSTVIETELSLIEFKADKQPIGLYEGMQVFKQIEIELEKGDSLYLFTDGFADQFGGTKGKKLMYKPFKKFLLDISSKNMNEQEELVGQRFNTWKGTLEQVDDVCVIGVKV